LTQPEEQDGVWQSDPSHPKQQSRLQMA